MKNIYIFQLFIFSLLITSCSDFLDKDPMDQYSDDTFWTTATEVDQALNACYSQLPKHYDGNTAKGELVFCAYSDDGHAREASADEIGDGAHNSQTGTVYNQWRYGEIRRINDFISHASTVESMDQNLKKRYIAEARFMRAFWYQRMLLFFRNIPLITKPENYDYYPFQEKPETVFNYILAELDTIENILPAKYQNSGDAGRITQGAVLMLKAQTCINSIAWHGDRRHLYTVAKESIQKIINSGLYQLEPLSKYEWIYQPESNNISHETILEVNLLKEFRTDPINVYRGPKARFGDSWSNHGAMRNLVDEYECIDGLSIEKSPLYDPKEPFKNRDPRLHITCILPGDSIRGKDGIFNSTLFLPHPDYNTEDNCISGKANLTGYNWQKYMDDDLDDNNLCYSNLVLMRYSEALLIMAEAENELGNPSEAIQYINRVRERVNMPNLKSGMSQEQLREAILHERRMEFAGEGMQRYVDILRWQLGEKKMNKSFWGLNKDNSIPGAFNKEKFLVVKRQFSNAKHTLWPIPQKALDNNYNLKQNPNW